MANIHFGNHFEEAIDCNVILTLPVEFKTHKDQVSEVKKELWDIISEKLAAMELKDDTPKGDEPKANTKEVKGKLIFYKPSKNMTQHLKPLYIKVYMEGWAVNRVLINNGTTVNILLISMMRKLSKVDSDLVPMDVYVYGFSRNATRTKGVLPVELR